MTLNRSLKSAEMKMLERVYAAEVEARLPFQTRAAMIKRLAAYELVEPMTAKFGHGGMVTVTGWQLTHKGRITYCEWASTQEAA